MAIITLELTHDQAEEWIRDLSRAIVLLDVGSKHSENMAHRRACLLQTNRLQDMAEAVDAAWRGVAAGAGG